MQPPPPIRRQRDVEVFRNAYGGLYNDEVTSASGEPGQYLRWRWSTPGVVVVPRWRDLIALIPVFRYPVNAVSWELPRGGREPGEPVEEAAVRELAEETGLTAVATVRLGAVFPETGLIESAVDVVEARIDSRRCGEAAAEAMESIAEPAWFNAAELRRAFTDQKVKCAITIAAVALVWARELDRVGQVSRAARPR